MARRERPGHRRIAVAGVVLGALLPLGTVACSSGTSARGPSQTVRSSTTAPAPSATGPSVIIDTDLSRWWDDATVIGLANVLHRRGALNLLGIVTDIPNPVAVAAVDAINTAYGHADIPLGAVARSDTDTAPHGYSDVLVQRLPHSVRSSDDVPEAVSVYRRLLANEPDGSVVIRLPRRVHEPRGPAGVAGRFRRRAVGRELVRGRSSVW